MGEGELESVMNQDKGEVEEVAARLQGRLVISVDEEEEQVAAEGFEHAVVMKLVSEKGVNRQAFVRTMSKVWRVKEDVFRELAGGAFLVMLSSEEERNKVLEGGPWNFMNQLVVTCKWEAGLAPFEYKFEESSVWVQVHNLPPEYMEGKSAEGMAEKCARLVGRLKHYSTVVTNKRRYMRLRVVIKVANPLCPGTLLQRRSREPLWLAFKYERMPFFCFRCGRIGHEERFCTHEKVDGDIGEWMRAEEHVNVAGAGGKFTGEEWQRRSPGSSGGRSNNTEESADKSQNLWMQTSQGAGSSKCMLEKVIVNDSGKSNDSGGGNEEAETDIPLVLLKAKKKNKETGSLGGLNGLKKDSKESVKNGLGLSEGSEDQGQRGEKPMDVSKGVSKKRIKFVGEESRVVRGGNQISLEKKRKAAVCGGNGGKEQPIKVARIDGERRVHGGEGEEMEEEEVSSTIGKYNSSLMISAGVARRPQPEA